MWDMAQKTLNCVPGLLYSLNRSATKNYREKNHSRKCVSILTGYPRTDRLRYVLRLLDQVDHQAPSTSGQYDIHVYCDGDCGTLQTKFPHVEFHSLPTSDTANPLLERLHNTSETVVLSGVEFLRHRWLYVSANYRRMLDDLFLPSPTRIATYRSCVILEDDLVLAPDALLYLDAAERVIQRDQTIFTASLFADNSYSLYAEDPRRFRRVSHFAGLGFVMTRQRYVDELRRTVWAGLRNWDEQVQTFVRHRGLVSIVPEVARALHLRRASNLLERSSSRLSPPRHPFESQLLNSEILPKYDLRGLELTAYDQSIADIIQRCPYIRYLADALFYDSVEDTVVYWDCKDDRDLHRILTERNLWGLGNGGVVRGSYNGSLFFRYYTAEVLMVCENSKFYRLRRRQTNSTFRPDMNFTPADGRRVKRRVAGLVHRLTADFHVLLAARNQSCDQACRDRNCDVTGLWLLNESCDVIGHVMPGCRRCATASVEAYADGVLPGMSVDDRRCWRGYPHYISCETASDRYRRICVCR